jgi:hypothetical protein
VRRWIIPAGILAAALIIGVLVWASGSEEAQLGLLTEIVGGLIVGVIFVIYADLQRRQRQAEGHQNTNGLILQWIAQPGLNLMEAFDALPESSDEAERSWVVCVRRIGEYKEAVHNLRADIDSDRLDQGDKTTRLLVEHFKLMMKVNPSNYSLVGIKDQVSTRDDAKHTAATVVEAHKELVASMGKPSD